MILGFEEKEKKPHQNKTKSRGGQYHKIRFQSKTK